MRYVIVFYLSSGSPVRCIVSLDVADAITQDIDKHDTGYMKFFDLGRKEYFIKISSIEAVTRENA